jgi:quercetin dioxygenase-like cupin family protein
MNTIVSLDKLERKELRDGMGHVEGEFWEVFTKETVGTEALRLLVQWYPPGGYTRNHPVHYDFEQAYYVVSGTMSVFLNEQRFTVPAGTFVFIPRGTPHYHQNDDDEPMVFLTINVPVRDGGVPPLTRPNDAVAPAEGVA